MLAQGRDFAGKWPDKTDTAGNRAGHEIVVPVFAYAPLDGERLIHDCFIPLLVRSGNAILVPNVRTQPSSARRTRGSVEVGIPPSVSPM